MRWLARGEHEVPPDDGWLTEREATYAAGLRFTKRHSEFLLRRWVCKHAVVTARGLEGDVATLARIEVGNRLSGAPYVELDGSPAGFDVSITDRAGWAVCVVGADLSRVGCDLEIVEPRSPGFVADFLTPAEQAYVRALPDGARDAAANLFWSAKESALKVLRTGLRRDTRSVQVHIDTADLETSGWQPLDVRASEGVVFPGWWRRDGAFLFTVTAEQPLDPPIALTGTADLATAKPTHSWLSQPLRP
jgi:4'-phosphopantetheinyl transferase